MGFEPGMRVKMNETNKKHSQTIPFFLVSVAALFTSLFFFSSFLSKKEIAVHLTIFTYRYRYTYIHMYM